MPETIVRFDDRRPIPAAVFIGNENDNLVESVEFELADWLSEAVVYIYLTANGKSDVINIGTERAFDVTRTHTSVAGRWEAYLEAYLNGDRVWHSDEFAMYVGALPAIGKQIEQQYPTAIEDALKTAAMLMGMGARIETLPEGSDPTVRTEEIDGRVVLVFGIPAGGGSGAGQNGATFIPHVSEDGTVYWTNDGGLSNPTPVNIMGPQGHKGEQGPQGEPGSVGETGPAGADGFSPTITATAIDGGHQLTITDVNGTQTINVWDGKDGETVDVDATLTVAGAAADAVATGARLSQLSEENAQRFMIHEMPVFLDRAKFAIAAPYTSLEILDARTFGLCVRFATSDLYRLNLASLEQEKLCTAGLAGGASNSNPWWFCGKLLPRWGTDYELALLWDRNNNRVCLIKTSDGTVLTAPTRQKLGWLRNTGIDAKYGDIGTFNQTAIYAEYWLPDFDADSSIDKVRVWRTTDGGYTWTEVFSQNTRVSDSPEVFHFHLVRNDPYNPDHWYLTSGDAASECHVWRSIDDGVTWTQIDDPNYSGDRQVVHRTCEMYFTEDYIYWGMDASDSDLGAAWVRTPRNLDTNQLSIEILADLKDRARQTVQTPYGVIIATEAQHSGTVNSFIWLAPYEDLTKPVLVATLPMAAFGNQISHYAYGGRFFSSEAWTDRTHKLYAPATADSRCNVIDLCMLSRPYW